MNDPLLVRNFKTNPDWGVCKNLIFVNSVMVGCSNAIQGRAIQLYGGKCSAKIVLICSYSTVGRCEQEDCSAGSWIAED